MRNIAIILAVILIAVAIVYWVVPAGSLPGWFPGFEAGAPRVRLKHGVAAAIAGVVMFGVAWWLGRRN